MDTPNSSPSVILQQPVRNNATKMSIISSHPNNNNNTSNSSSNNVQQIVYPTSSGTPSSGSTTVTANFLHDIKEEDDDLEIVKLKSNTTNISLPLSDEQTPRNDEQIDTNNNMSFNDESIISADENNTKIQDESVLHHHLDAVSSHKVISSSSEELSLLPPLPNPSELKLEVTQQRDTQDLIETSIDSSHNSANSNGNSNNNKSHRSTASSDNTPNGVIGSGINNVATNHEINNHLEISNSSEDANNSLRDPSVIINSTNIDNNSTVLMADTSNSKDFMLEDVNTSFDLSKALEMSGTPSHSKNKEVLMDKNLENNENINTRRISLEQPRISLESSGLSKVISIPMLKDKPSRNNSINNNNHNVNNNRKSSLTHISIDKIPSTGNTSSESHNLERNLSRKFSIESYNHKHSKIKSSEEKIYQLPKSNDSKRPQLLTTRSEMFSLNPPRISTSTSSYSTTTQSGEANSSDIITPTSSSKKLPLLRRASSALLRKSSMKLDRSVSNGNSNTINDTNSPMYNPSTPNAVNERVPLRSRSSFQTLNSVTNNNIGLQRNSTELSRSRSNSILTRKISISSKVKRGISRIISSTDLSSTDKLNSTSRLARTLSNANSLAGSSDFTNSDSVTPISNVSENIISPRTNVHDDTESTMDENYFSLPKRRMSSCAKEIKLDLDKFKSTIPTIYVTDKVGSKFSTPVLKQSILSIDSANGEDTLSIREYIDILIDFQKKEDYRYNLIEKNFETSGWCSANELRNLRNKRLLINKMWEERISFLANKVESLEA